MAHLDLDQLLHGISELSAERSAAEIRINYLVDENQALTTMVDAQRVVISQLETAARQANEQLIPFFNMVAADLKARVALEGDLIWKLPVYRRQLCCDYNSQHQRQTKWRASACVPRQSVLIKSQPSRSRLTTHSLTLT